MALKTEENILEWFERGEELVQQLTAKRNSILSQIEVLQNEIERIDQHLARILGMSKPCSFPQKVLNILKEEPEGLNGTQILQRLRRAQPHLNKSYLRTTLYRLSCQKRILHIGRRGAYLYRLKTSKVCE